MSQKSSHKNFILVFSFLSRGNDVKLHILTLTSQIIMNGHKYFLTIVDDHTRFVWIFIVTSKAETQTHLQAFVSYIERQFNTKVKTIRSDNGVEFVIKQFYHSTGRTLECLC